MLQHKSKYITAGLIMSKGYFDNITKGYKINDVRLPVFNPVELINFKYKDAIIDDIISIDAPKKKKRKAKAVKH